MGRLLLEARRKVRKLGRDEERLWLRGMECGHGTAPVGLRGMHYRTCHAKPRLDAPHSLRLTTRVEDLLWARHMPLDPRRINQDPKSITTPTQSERRTNQDAKQSRRPKG